MKERTRHRLAAILAALMIAGIVGTIIFPYTAAFNN